MVTVAQKREIRLELENYDLTELMSGKKIIPTKLMEMLLKYFHGMTEDQIYSIGEGKKSELCGEALTQLFIGDEQKKSD